MQVGLLATRMLYLIETETYVGGHVEALNSGVFRADFRYKFNIDPAARREMDWQWRGETFPASRSEIKQIGGS